MSKIRIGVVFGGRSGEHEVSVMSAKSIICALDPQKYEVVPIGLTKQGRWVLMQESLDLIRAGQLPSLALEQLDPEYSSQITLLPDPTKNKTLDVIFPVMHGTYGEDGTLQGLLELANIPYVGAGVASSAVSMDKGMMRTLFAAAKLPLLPWVTLSRYQWEQDPHQIVKEIQEKLGYPCFVKPANLGSSVGVSKANSGAELNKALCVAAEFDRRIIVEQAAHKPREIECSVLGNDNPMVSIAGEVIPGNDFYDYEDKYINENSKLCIPADITAKQLSIIQDLAIRAYQAVDCAGMARVDFFLDGHQQILLNEINTIPGFTRISMYPKLWEASGVPIHQLVDKLVEYAIERHQDRSRSRTTI